MDSLTTKSLAQRLRQSEVSVRKKLRIYEATTGQALPRSIEGGWCVSATVADQLELANNSYSMAEMGAHFSFEAALRTVLGLPNNTGMKTGVSRVDETLLAELDLLRKKVKQLQHQLLESQQRQNLLDRQSVELARVFRRKLENR